jgi:hypothetical protein
MGALDINLKIKNLGQTKKDLSKMGASSAINISKSLEKSLKKAGKNSGTSFGNAFMATVKGSEFAGFGKFVYTIINPLKWVGAIKGGLSKITGLFKVGILGVLNILMNPFKSLFSAIGAIGGAFGKLWDTLVPEEVQNLLKFAFIWTAIDKIKDKMGELLDMQRELRFSAMAASQGTGKSATEMSQSWINLSIAMSQANPVYEVKEFQESIAAFSKEGVNSISDLKDLVPAFTAFKKSVGDGADAFIPLLASMKKTGAEIPDMNKLFGELTSSLGDPAQVNALTSAVVNFANSSPLAQKNLAAVTRSAAGFAKGLSDAGFNAEQAQKLTSSLLTQSPEELGIFQGGFQAIQQGDFSGVISQISKIQGLVKGSKEYEGMAGMLGKALGMSQEDVARLMTAKDVASSIAKATQGVASGQGQIQKVNAATKDASGTWDTFKNSIENTFMAIANRALPALNAGIRLVMRVFNTVKGLMGTFANAFMKAVFPEEGKSKKTIWQKIAGWIDSLSISIGNFMNDPERGGRLTSFIAGIGSSMGGFFNSLLTMDWSKIGDGIGSAFTSIGTFFTNLFGGKEGEKGPFSKFTDWLSTLTSEDITKGFWNIVDVGKAILSVFSGIGAVFTTVSSTISGIISSFKSAKAYIEDMPIIGDAMGTSNTIKLIKSQWGDTAAKAYQYSMMGVLGAGIGLAASVAGGGGTAGMATGAMSAVRGVGSAAKTVGSGLWGVTKGVAGVGSGGLTSALIGGGLGAAMASRSSTSEEAILLKDIAQMISVQLGIQYQQLEKSVGVEKARQMYELQLNAATMGKK